MGEIMRWRMARAPQRRVPDPITLVYLGAAGGSYPIDDQTRARLEAIGQGAGPGSAFDLYSQILADAPTLRQYLTASPLLPQSTIQIFIALFQLDQWLASVGNRPTVAALDGEINGLLGAYLNTPDWAAVHSLLAGLYYAALILSAAGVNFPMTEVLGWLTRWLLIITLVDTLVAPGTPIQTPADIYNALRWRTLVLPLWLALLLVALRLRNQAILVRKPGFSDLYITREEWDHYERAEIASIENILAGELKSRVHILVNQTQTTTTTDTTTTTVKEQDSTTTDLTQLQQQSSTDISLAAHADGQVDTSGLYGPTQVNTHLGGSLDYSSASANSSATTQSHETVSRAVSKIEQTTRQIRTTSTMSRTTDRETHKFDNTGKLDPIVGVYRWVDQLQNVELDRYPNRFLMEFELPEPGAWIRWMHQNDIAANMVNQPPIPLTATGLPTDPPLTARDVAGATYPGLAARYGAAGISPVPAEVIVAENVTYPQPQQSGVAQYFQVDTNLTVPSGYEITDAYASVMQFTQTTNTPPVPAALNIALGAGTPTQLQPQPGVEDLQTMRLDPAGVTQGVVPISIFGAQLEGFTVNIELTCRPREAYEQWQNDTYDLIVAAYNSMLQAYNDEKAGLTLQQTNPVDANSPDQNVITVQQELKRQVIEMLIGRPFNGLNAITWAGGGTGTNEPRTILSTAASVAPEIQFLEQAFEWETLSYICYPYYWADISRWKDLASITGSDSVFADFLRAGSARVVLAARPGFEAQVNFYLYCGVLWGGGPVPAPDDADYLSIADEIRAQQQGPLDVTVVDGWQVRLPTALICLDSHDQLPMNPSPTIVVINRIYPGAGHVGDTVVISGSNFGAAQGSSTVSFNGVAATPGPWHHFLITTPVPAGATSGPVTVTINGVTSNAVPFTVF